MEEIVIPFPDTPAARRAYAEANHRASLEVMLTGQVRTVVEFRKCLCGAPVRYDDTLPCGH